MKPILASLAQYLSEREAGLLGRTTVILPNRRSGLFLQQHLARQVRGISWSPVIRTISDFIGEMSGLEQADALELPFMLYDLYRKEVEHAEPLDEFYPWGEIMLTDFDELDKYLVEAGMLFGNVLDIKEIEDPLAGLDEQQIHFIRQFWDGFQAGGQSREKGRFLELWRILPRLYEGLREQLFNERRGYPGMQYRECTRRIERGEMTPPETEIIVAGFNALNTCEKTIFTWLKQHGALFFWDYDHVYLTDGDSEAGRFMRENVRMFPPPVELDSFNGFREEKHIRVFELPSDVLQAKTLYRILEEKGPLSSGEYTEAAVILCDEELLMPVLTSLPEKVREINITMGYPMKNTPVFSFIDALLKLRHNSRPDREGGTLFYHRDVVNVLFHPYMRMTGEPSAGDRIGQINRDNLIYVDQRLFSGPLENRIFRRVEGAGALLGYFREVFRQILDHLTGEDPKVQEQLDRELILRLIIYLNKLESVLAGRGELTEVMVERLLRKILATIRVPFEGEPLAGIQIMGILETRMLDFDHVVFLSMNEEIMPAAHYGTSFIPYSLRRAFHLPAREERDAIYAYYFNRMIQRATKVDLLYNSGSDGIRNGEMSRYVHQLMYSRKVELIHPGLDIRAVAVPDLEVPLSLSAVEGLAKFREGAEEEKYLSPSAINAYLDCTMKFYLRYLAGIGETEEVKEEIDAAGFGTIVHETIRILYEAIRARNRGMIPKEELEGLLRSSEPEKVLRDTFLIHHYHGKRLASIEGRNIIALRVMLRYLEKIIRTDLLIAPFELISTEASLYRTLTIQQEGRHVGIRLGGKIDRIDRAGGRIRVIDYKTGEAKVNFPTLESLFDSSLSQRNGAALQTLFYAWLVRGAHPQEGITPGLYAMRSLYDPTFDPILSMGSRGSHTRIESFAALEEEFIGQLTETLEQLFHPEGSFSRTEHRSKCRICPFAKICSRDLGE